MRVSFSSTREVSVVTFSLTAPTSVRTNFFVAQPVVPAASATTGTIIRYFFITRPSSAPCRQYARRLALARLTEITTAGAHGQFAAPRSHVQLVPARFPGRLEGDQILMTELGDQVARRLARVRRSADHE